MSLKENPATCRHRSGSKISETMDIIVTGRQSPHRLRFPETGHKVRDQYRLAAKEAFVGGGTDSQRQGAVALAGALARRVRRLGPGSGIRRAVQRGQHPLVTAAVAAVPDGD